jgi:hypothetical protein
VSNLGGHLLSGTLRSVSESDYLQPLWTKSPVGWVVQGCLWKTFSQVFATMPGPLLRQPHDSVRVLIRTWETLFAATASGSSSATS